ncbi:MAG TPA: hypothetical protein VGK42_01230 [Candidatus Dormibacteraeota bacterium]
MPARLKDVAEGSVARATLIAGGLPAPFSTALLHAAQDAYTVGMADILRVSAGAMVAGAVLVGAFMPVTTNAAWQEVETPDGANTGG